MKPPVVGANNQFEFEIVKSAVFQLLGMAGGWNWLAGLAGPAPAPASQFRPAEQAVYVNMLS